MVPTNRALLILLCSLLGLGSYAQGEASLNILPGPSISSLNTYGLSDGLPVNCLENAVFDQKGRLWLSGCSHEWVVNKSSFFQFDGQRTSSFIIDKAEKSGVQDSLRWYVQGETSNGFLFGTDYGFSTVFFWHPDTRQKHFYPLHPEEQILNVVPEAEGNILVLVLKDATYRVYRLSPAGKQVVGEITLNFREDEIISFHSLSFVINSNKAWFFHENQGLVFIDLINGNAQFHNWKDQWQLRLPQLDDQTFNPSNCIVSFEEGKLLLFLGTENGFFTLHSNNLEMKPYKKLNQLLYTQHPEEKLFVYFFQDLKDQILLSLSKQANNKDGEIELHHKIYLLELDGQLKDYTPIILGMRASVQNVLKGKFGGNLFSRDFNQEILWTYTGGLVIGNLQADLGIQTISTKEGTRAIAYLDSNQLIVKTDSPFRKIDLKTGENQTLPSWTQTGNTFSNFELTQEKKWWFTGSENNLLQYNSANNQFSEWSLGVKAEKFIFLNDQKLVFFAPQGDIFFYDLNEKTSTPFLFNNAPFSIGSQVNDLHLQSDNLLYVAASNGLWQINLSTQKVIHFDESDGLLDATLNCLSEDKNGSLWLGTGKAGLLLFDPQNKTVKQISTEDGLSHKTVAGILQDDEGNFWVSTFNGLTVLNPKGNVLFRLGEEHGLIHNEFNRLSYAKLPDGRMVFGGIAGLNILDPKKILELFANQNTPQIFLTQWAFFDKKMQENRINKGTYKQNKPIRIPATNRYLSLDFAISEYTDQTDHNYSYRIIPRQANDGLDQSTPWTNLGPISELTINNLPVGHWLVQVNAIDQNGNQVESPLEIPIHVQEFFYRTWWFYFLCSLPFLFGAWIWIRRIYSERKRLQILVERRTEQIQKDKEVIEQQAQELRSLDETKTRFFTNISHELRTPLTIISGMAQKVKQDPEQWSIKGSKMIQRNADELLNLVNQILDLRKLESGKLEPKLIQGNVIPFLHYIFESFHSMGADKNIQLAFQAEEDPLLMDYDPEMILRIVSNLLSNAIKYSETDGSVQMKVQRVPRPSELPAHVPEYLLLTVKDEGIGISAKELPHIFDRFYQVDDSTTRKGEGTGIGLSLTHELIKLLGGKIAVQSTQGEGSSFMVHLPIQGSAPLTDQPTSFSASIPAYASLATEEELLDTTAVSKKNDQPSLLIIEDNADVRQYLSICLDSHYQLSYAEDGAAGIEKALEEVPDIIISDVMMPKKDGFEVCDQLKKDVRTSHIPIILLTAKSDAESRIGGLQQGADAYLSKPFNEKELLVRLEKLLELRKTLQERYLRLGGKLPTDASSSRPEDDFIAKIQDIIRNSLADESFGTMELGRSIGMSRTQLHNKLKALTGLSTSRYLRSIRIHEAKERLVKHPELNISDIAYETGFANLKYFSKIFSEEVGTSPSKYRKTYLSEQ